MNIDTGATGMLTPTGWRPDIDVNGARFPVLPGAVTATHDGGSLTFTVDPGNLVYCPTPSAG